jgi:hypothetical protein
VVTVRRRGAIGRWLRCESKRGDFGGFCGAVEFWVREKKSWGYGGFVLLSQLRQQLRGLPAVPEREFPSGMPLSSIVPALVLQHGKFLPPQPFLASFNFRNQKSLNFQSATLDALFACKVSIIGLVQASLW